MKLGLLKKCCCCVGLRHGCIAIATVDFIINLVLVNFGSDHIATRIEHAVAICHCIGCILLLFGALIVSTILLIFYLITSFINSVILFVFSIYLIIYALATTVFVVITCSILICTNIYFWLVVYSYYRGLITYYDNESVDGTEV